MMRSTLPPARFDGLSVPRRRLVAFMQSLSYGRIEGLQIRGREPVFAPAPTVVREIKLAAERTPPRPEGDFPLKAQIVDLFGEFDRLRDGVVLSLEVHNGLPFRMSLGEAIG